MRGVGRLLDRFRRQREPFDLNRDRVEAILYLVYGLQTAWTFGAAVILAATPRRRFSGSWQFVLSVPGGQYGLALMFAAVSAALAVSLVVGRPAQQTMARGLLAGGVLCVLFGVFLGLGTANSPTGVLGWWFCFYVGPHLLLQAALLTAINGRP